MRAVAQRVASASVTVDGQAVGLIGPGLLVYVGSATEDAPADIAYVADKVANLRIFPDEAGKMNRSVGEAGGAILAVPAFTTMADARQGRRPGFAAAARPETALSNFEQFVSLLRAKGLTVETGRFREHMHVASVNDGPICVLLDSRKTF